MHSAHKRNSPRGTLREHPLLDLLTRDTGEIDKLRAFPLQCACMQSSSRLSLKLQFRSRTARHRRYVDLHVIHAGLDAAALISTHIGNVTLTRFQSTVH